MRWLRWRTMRQRAERLLQDLMAAGNPDLDYVAALSRRVSLLADSPRPLLFGRIDEEDGPTWRIGRRHVEDTRSDPVVIDWRAPVAVPFYRASAKDALGLTRRRQIMVDRGSVMAVADDLFGGAGDVAGTTRLRGGDALLAELERARTGEMLDIVATIQAEQDEIIRAPLDAAADGAGGTRVPGKTAVGLHRAAFLLYNHPELSREGVLVLGPSRAFLRYIAQVLPSLGRRGRRPDDHRRHRAQGKGPRRGADGGSTDQGRRPHGRAPSSRPRRAGGGPWRKTSASACASPGRPWAGERVNDLVASIVARPAPYKAGRLALRARLVSEARTAFRSSGRLGADEAWFEGELTSSEEFGALLDTLWPTVSPTTLVRDLLSSRGQLGALRSGLFSPDEGQLLLRSRGTTVAPLPGAPTTWRCSTRRRSSRGSAPAPTGTSWWTRPRI